MSTTYRQQNRRIAVSTPLGDDVLLLTSFTGREEMSRLFHFELEMLSEKESIDAKEIVGKNVTFFVRDAREDCRYFNGYVKRFAYCGMYDRLSKYRMEVVPWYWFLTRNTDCRIFQDKTVPQIIEQVFNDRGFQDFDASGITGKHPKHEYRVQYNESDFQFLSRLMEEEGIFYCFKHENGKHTLMLADQKTAHENIHEDDTIEFTSANLSGVEITDEIYEWEHCYEYRSGKVAHKDFDFENPTANLLTGTNTVFKLDNNDKFELYEYPGGYTDKSEGEGFASLRIEEEEARHDMVVGESMCRWFSPGFKFKIGRHHSQAEGNKGFLLTVVEHQASLAGSYLTGADVPDVDYKNRFTCIPDSVKFRPERSTPKPVVPGSQTGIVVGPKNEEIYTDKYGRVKVHFHWDRYGKADENSSCWVRVAQVWAGAKWGGMFIPRIGQEVIVDFLEGDADQPIITGRVYNGDNMPPYDLPDNQTMSGVKSRSTPNATDDDFNEIRFEDKKGSEQIYIQAQRNLDIRVENDRFETVEHDRHLTVENDKFEHVKDDRHENVDRHHHETIGQDRHLDVKGKEAKAVTKSLSLTVGGDVAEVFKAKHSMVVTDDSYIKAKNIVIEADTNITIKVGKSFIAIENGGITIDTPGALKLTSGGATDVIATAALKLEGTGGAELTGPKTKVNGDGMVEVSGGLVKIN